MDQSRKNPLRAARDIDVRAGAGADLVLRNAARRLLDVKDVPDAERAIVDAVRTGCGAAWAAIYRPRDDLYHYSTGDGDSPGELPRELPTLVRSLVASEAQPARCDGVDEIRRHIPDAGAMGELRVEHELEFPLLLVGGFPSELVLDDSLELLAALLDIASSGLRNAELVERLRSQVFVDFVTGCYNRRAFEEHLNVELVRARRYSRPLSLLLLDLDGFKEVNDEMGHPMGDYVLRRVGEVLRSAFRTTDRICRYGGDEFAVIFPETPRDEVVRLAERLGRQVASIFPDEVVPTAISVSIGVAAYPRDAAAAEELVAAADRALYGAKAGGRNRVVSA